MQKKTIPVTKFIVNFALKATKLALEKAEKS